MSFGTNLKNILKEKNMTQTDLAKALNCKQALISRWVSGRSGNPKMETLEKLSGVFGVPAEYFVSNGKIIKDGSGKINKNEKSGDIEYLKLLMEKQGRLIEEINKKFEAEIKSIRKEIQLIK